SGGDPKNPTATKAEILLTYTDSDQRRTGEVVSQLSRRLIEQSQLNNSARLRSIIRAIEQRLPNVKQELSETEQVLEQYDRIKTATSLNRSPVANNNNNNSDYS
ncbi:MAG: hypothetical protein C4287_11315, partial [Leptolyngbya sp. ERB_1_2]